nr:immunoglobulin light chain junction region [Macaca mulatta]MPO03310.1 immunoglobulin light chain junction region [Macaca mulatta]MPO03400.1 immunoglobulin light chain junction region [Macaca mulatta]MPO03414.1 immunoglobulin light chain junction region [Macaca mulatta]MPO03513.1 immunoglobulin light chain junction region [Macaca mulatta]
CATWDDSLSGGLF